MTDERTVVLLPGLDGSGLLFEDFVARTPPGYRTQVVIYPGDRVLSYAELEPLVREQLPSGPYWLVAESYSGPLAVRLAARPQGDLRGLVLAASFVTPPGWRVWRLLPWRTAFRSPAPASLLRWVMRLDSRPGTDRFRTVAQSATPEVLAARVRETLTVDVRAELRAVEAPILYLAAKHDRVVAKRCARTITALRPDATVTTIDAGHPVLQLKPDAAWRAIAAFTGHPVPQSERRLTPRGK